MARSSITAGKSRLAPLELKRLEADGSFTGYASLFGRIDMGGDLVLPGAFRQSLAEKGPAGIKLLFQHNPDEPIGVWLELAEDARGLRVHGRLLPEVARAREVLSLMRAGALDGLSIGFRTVKGRTDPKTGIRRLSQIDLWEISIVTFPMLADARVSFVKQRSAPQPEVGGPPMSGAARLASKFRRAAETLREHRYGA